MAQDHARPRAGRRGSPGGARCAGRPRPGTARPARGRPRAARPAHSGRSSGRRQVSVIARRRWSGVPAAIRPAGGGRNSSAAVGREDGAAAGAAASCRAGTARPARRRSRRCAAGDHRLDQQVEIGVGGAVVGEVDPDREAARQARRRGRGDAALLQVGDDLGVEAIGRLRRRSPAPRRRKQTMLRATGASSCSRGCSRTRAARSTAWRQLSAIAAPSRRVPCSLQREPHLERAKAARQLRPELAWPGLAAGEAARGALEIAGVEGEGGAVQVAAADQHAAGVVLDVEPFVEVEGERIGTLDAGEQRPVRGAQDRERAERAVDVQPEALLARDVGERGEIVDRAGVDRAGGADDAERPQAEPPVGGDRPRELGGVDPVVGARPGSSAARCGRAREARTRARRCCAPRSRRSRPAGRRAATPSARTSQPA